MHKKIYARKNKKILMFKQILSNLLRITREKFEGFVASIVIYQIISIRLLRHGEILQVFGLG